MVAHQLAVQRPGADPLVALSSLDSLNNSVMLRKSGLVFAHRVEFDKWETIGQQILSVSESTTWWIADWIAYGEKTFQDRYREAVRWTSLNYQTLRNYVWVARRFDLSRRRDNLSFGHHAEVAALEQPEQDYWLRKAEELTWSRNQLRNEVRNSLRLRQADDESPTEHSPAGAEDRTRDSGHGAAAADHVEKVLSLHLTTSQFEQFMMVAHSRNQELEEWALQALESECLSPSDLLVAGNSYAVRNEKIRTVKGPACLLGAVDWSSVIASARLPLATMLSRQRDSALIYRKLLVT